LAAGAGGSVTSLSTIGAASSTGAAGLLHPTKKTAARTIRTKRPRQQMEGILFVHSFLLDHFLILEKR
jgi:hypothetical protein